MAVFRYKAVDKNGNIVTNKVEVANRFVLLKQLKRNDLLPISVRQIVSRGSTVQKQKRNVEANDSVLKGVRRQDALKSKPSKVDQFMVKLNDSLGTTQKITNRDIVVFTQNFYLLKKANFNNIHALSTVINTTENRALRMIIEDILVGVESGENMYVTMEYYSGVFHPIYVNMIKVGELSRTINNIFRASGKIFG